MAARLSAMCVTFIVRGLEARPCAHSHARMTYRRGGGGGAGAHSSARAPGPTTATRLAWPPLPHPPGRASQGLPSHTHLAGRRGRVRRRDLEEDGVRERRRRGQLAGAGGVGVPVRDAHGRVGEERDVVRDAPRVDVRLRARVVQVEGHL